MASETHIAGLALEISERYLIQRCAWCGTVLLAYDYARTAVAGDEWSRPGEWTAGGLVRYQYDGDVARWGEIALSRTIGVALDDEKLPDDACALNLPLDA
jgi:hypothetical protein